MTGSSCSTHARTTHAGARPPPRRPRRLLAYCRRPPARLQAVVTGAEQRLGTLGSRIEEYGREVEKLQVRGGRNGTAPHCYGRVSPGAPGRGADLY
jgi:hypothetical protein